MGLLACGGNPDLRDGGRDATLDQSIVDVIQEAEAAIDAGRDQQTACGLKPNYGSFNCCDDGVACRGACDPAAGGCGCGNIPGGCDPPAVCCYLGCTSEAECQWACEEHMVPDWVCK